jgi:hypothetical protein
MTVCVNGKEVQYFHVNCYICAVFLCSCAAVRLTRVLLMMTRWSNVTNSELGRKKIVFVICTSRYFRNMKQQYQFFFVIFNTKSNAFLNLTGCHGVIPEPLFFSDWVSVPFFLTQKFLRIIILFKRKSDPKKFSSYRTVNTLCLGYSYNKSVNVI